MVYALGTGSGKDAVLALHSARASGLDVRFAFNLYDAESGRVAFHGTRKDLVDAQAHALNLELVQAHTGPEDYEAVLVRVLEDLKGRGVGGVVFGNIHLADVREWYDERIVAAGLRHSEPLWGQRPGELVRDFIAHGYRATIVSVDLEKGLREWLGAELTFELVRSIEEAGSDPCGEHGEYHTFVWDGPEFRRPLKIQTGEVVEMKGHALIDLTLA